MKEIRAIVRLEKVDEVKEALEHIGVPGLTIAHVEGHGRQSGLVEQFRGREFKVDLLPKARIDIVCKDEEVERIASAIREVAKTGEIGDGKIFIYPVENAIRIRSGETGESAV